MTSKLEMIFLNQSDKKSKIVVDSPKSDITEHEIKTVMQMIIDKNIFNTTGGDLVAINSARIIETDVINIIVEE
ncbi:DUF2922 domain-containing protein [Caminicella sporogenes]|uniref:DUF2922 domain-containing protein n=1 Tax=Caminicella sporogenes TaxID=166485 RepID=UPI00254254EA|nr:DUF2922 domain-containing protein [Caminicella sporogenes]WIF96121.1 DUF2922 domain-containing protein [Caminicella sporogenes]